MWTVLSFQGSMERLKPIFHCKLGSRWVTNANEMSTNNMKYRWPTEKNCVGDPTQPIFHWLALGFCIGGNAHFMFHVRGNTTFSVFRYQHVGIPTQDFRVWGLDQCEAPTQELCVTVEYRL